MHKKFSVPKETTNFLKNTLVEYKRVGKTNSYKITHQAELISYNDHTGLNLKEIIVQPRNSWKEEAKQINNKIDLLLGMVKDLVSEVNTIKSEVNTIKTEVNVIKAQVNSIDNRLKKVEEDMIEVKNDIKVIKSLPTIKKELKEMN